MSLKKKKKKKERRERKKRIETTTLGGWGGSGAEWRCSQLGLEEVKVSTEDDVD